MRAAARLAGSQMDPVGPDFHALVALAPLRMLDGRDRTQVLACLVGHRSSFDERHVRVDASGLIWDIPGPAAVHGMSAAKP
jgi:hypothetical protein